MKRKTSWFFFRQLRSIILLPGIVTIVIPVLILWQTPRSGLGWELPSPWVIAPLLFGLFILLAGFLLMYHTISLIVSIGRGTLAPWDPTQKLVVRGPYRHVRNPMISGVLAVLLGEAILLGAAPLLAYFLCATLLNMMYIPLLEEPGLVKRFGEDYLRYKKNVPRWIPRFTPWDA